MLISRRRFDWRDVLLIIIAACAVFCAFVAAIFYIRWLGWGEEVRAIFRLTSQSPVPSLRYAFSFGVPCSMIAFAAYLAVGRRAGLDRTAALVGGEHGDFGNPVTRVRALPARLRILGAIVGLVMALIFGAFARSAFGAFVIIAASATVTWWSLAALSYRPAIDSR